MWPLDRLDSTLSTSVWMSSIEAVKKFLFNFYEKSLFRIFIQNSLFDENY
jgi:hypothetical protein